MMEDSSLRTNLEIIGYNRPRASKQLYFKQLFIVSVIMNIVNVRMRSSRGRKTLMQATDRNALVC